MEFGGVDGWMVQVYFCLCGRGGGVGGAGHLPTV